MPQETDAFNLRHVLLCNRAVRIPRRNCVPHVELGDKLRKVLVRSVNVLCTEFQRPATLQGFEQALHPTFCLMAKRINQFDIELVQARLNCVSPAESGVDRVFLKMRLP